MTEEEKDRSICWECVGDVFLRSEIQRRGVEDECSYCERHQKTISIGEMADEIEIALREHFFRTPTEPSDIEYSMSAESDHGWERRGDPITFIIEDCAQIEREPAEDIQKMLEKRHHSFNTDIIGDEEPFEENAQYAPSGVDTAESQAGWLHFEKTLKTQARYFSRFAEETLASIFEGIADHTTHDGHPVIVEAGPNKPLKAVFRARVFQSDGKLEESLKRPDKDIGPPPSILASAGRMNAHGISVFYGATDPMVALAEVRPPVGSKVVIARFEFLRTVRLLDVEALRTVALTGNRSVFDRSLLPRMERAEFLKWLSQRITMPVMPDDEPFEYLATQAIADFLATNANPPLDGILYPSVQGAKGKLNIVLFHKAAHIQPLDIPEGTEISAQLYQQDEEGFEIYPWVSELVPSEEPPRPDYINLGPESPLAHEGLGPPVSGDYDYEQGPPVLKLDVSDLQVHVVRMIEFETDSHEVHRHRVKKRGAAF